MISVKTAKEIDEMRLACHISAEVLALAGKAVRPGITTAYLDKLIYDYIVGQGAKPSFKGYGGFPGSACISVNDTVIHGIPSKSIVLKEGDIVSIDVGAEINGFNGDNAATFACGTVSNAAQTLMDVTRESLALGIAAAVTGARVGDIGAAVQNCVEQNGFSVVRTFVGHGVGRKLHEEPEVPNFGPAGRGARLVSGMTLAIEPMVNEKSHVVKTLSDEWTVKTVDGGLSAHFEHTIAITSNGPEILTVPREKFEG
ncbi:MAG: type I methionyl aminopeptidase [Oscillospiraceae bacterium]|nr:type I methionyl aminopeptidase [Oscillospiraceae bacterium]